MNNLEKYNELRDTIKTGDIIGFSGDGLVSAGIKISTGSDLSHVAMALVDDCAYMGKMIFLYESTTLIDLPDVISGEIFSGVQIQLASQRFATYDGKIYLYRLKQQLTDEQQIILLDSIRRKHKARIKYDTRQAIQSGLDVFDRFGCEAKEDGTKLFCSEGLVFEYKNLKIIGARVNASEQTPGDLVKFGFVNPDREEISD